MKKYNNGFTLVEMLVAMLLFAIIAVMLIPNVMQNAEKNLFITQTKKVQNDVQQAFLWIISENQGSMRTACVYDDTDPQGRKCIRNLISGTTDATKIPKKLESYCSFGGVTNDDHVDNHRKEASNPAEQHQAYTARDPRLLNNDPVSNAFSTGFVVSDNNAYHAVYLKNGAYVSVVFSPDDTNTYCNNSPGIYVPGASGSPVCGYVEIDVNGGKIPNTVGKDIHYFWITEKDGIVPFGEMDNLTCGEMKADGVHIDKIPEKSTAGVLTQLGCTARLVNMSAIDYY